MNYLNAAESKSGEGEKASPCCGGRGGKNVRERLRLS